ncbi:PatB family C-S lyase [Sinanaerobacter sp. ZZT-01]|uniref:MalY/PatB family protein n=1 Tax=Sinanaerobacter sp. ZZT-01 TaxID=3111540 RepID=UPI002D7762FB|nr:PatB family C-S lyase [Sinanaerobacter sp. ZZT-01]WRR94846.1 PatB family C-S lyase [Sinanaerobacter sp. ZZT-01]
MKYNFDKIIDRSEQHAAKYDERFKKFGRDDIIPLWIADMDFETAQPIIDAVKKRANQGIYGYTSRPSSYYESICQWQRRHHNWEIDPNQISFAPGIVPALSELVHEFTEPGDAVLIQTPVYPEFYDVIEAWKDRKVIENQLIEENGSYTMDFSDLEEKLKRKPKLFLFCSPHNPVGRVWKKEELERMTGLCIRHEVPIVSDEIHSDLLLWGSEHIPTATISKEVAGQTISCISSTKSFNLAGLQAASIIFPNKEWKNRFDSFWGGLDIHRNNCFSLVAIEAACRHGDEWLQQLLVYVEENMLFVREFLHTEIPEIKVSLPEATYLLWLDCRELMDYKNLWSFMIHEAKIGLNNGADFCRSLDGYLRMNVACPRVVLKRALEQLREAVQQLHMR